MTQILSTPRPAAPPRRRNDPAAMRGRVLDAAVSLFQRQGYAATSTHQIVAEAGVTPGAMHHHFPSKKAIGIAVIRERVARIVHTSWIAPMADGDSVLDAIAAIFETICAGLDERGAVRGCPLSNLALELSFGDADFRAEIAPLFEGWRAAIADRLRADQQAGLFPNVDPAAFAMHVAAAYSGAMTLAKADQKTAALRITVRELVRCYAYPSA